MEVKLKMYWFALTSEFSNFILLWTHCEPPTPNSSHRACLHTTCEIKLVNPNQAIPINFWIKWKVANPESQNWSFNKLHPDLCWFKKKQNHLKNCFRTAPASSSASRSSPLRTRQPLTTYQERSWWYIAVMMISLYLEILPLIDYGGENYDYIGYKWKR